MDAREMERRILVRHRAPGHVRFEVPQDLCETHCSAAIRRSLISLPGVYRVEFYGAQCKLSIHYDETACTLREVGLRLRQALQDAARSGLFERHAPAPAHPVAAAQPAGATPRPRAADWLRRKGESLRRKAQELRFKARIVKEVAKVKAETDPALRLLMDEKAIIGFLNDLTAFYLVKIHWDLITKHWIRAPFAHRYHWMAVFYLVFLLVRSRRQALKK
ncbi:MAG TPA: heavy-metal-associated domain-containing protein [Rhodocyclaceae bacterium]|jgi:hypothetical protein|nr:heavy-metal-associated domain-containing protein [Rhodocyclaceae bacterium]